MARKSVSGTLKEEINNARTNLDNLLQKINNSKDTGLSQTDDEGEDNLLLADPSLGREGGVRDGSPKRKGVGPAGKKKRRPATTLPHTSTANTYIVKLFDRSVDLAQYGPSSPLYPICRSWMRNTANEQCIEQPSPPEQLTGGESQFPEPYMANEQEDLYKLRIPEPIKRKDKPLDIYAEPEDAAKLLIDHIAHWKRVRRSWGTAAKAYEARFSTSHALIKQMYETASK